MLSCTDASDDEGVADESEHVPDAVPEGPEAIGIPGAPVPAAGQVTVLDGEEPDPEDPTILHVPAKAGTEAFVIAASQALLQAAAVDASVADNSLALRIRSAQAFFARMAWHDVVRVAHALTISEPIVTEGGEETTLRAVEFETEVELRAAWDPVWSERLHDIPGGCGLPLPTLGERRLFFMAMQEDMVTQEENAHTIVALRLTDDDHVLGVPGLAVALPNVQSALSNAEGLLP